MNKLSPTYWALRFSLPVLGLVVLFLSACENDVADIQRVIQPEEMSVERARSVELLYSDSAIVRVRIQAETMLSHLNEKEPYREFPDGVHVDIFNDNGQVGSRLIAKHATHYTKQHKVILRDSVVVWNAKGERLTTEKLIWDEKKEKIYSDEQVTVRTATEVIYGHNFEATQDFSSWHIKNVKGIVNADNLIPPP